MKYSVVFLCLLSLTLTDADSLSAAELPDTSQMRCVVSTESFQVYAEDSRVYSDYLSSLESIKRRLDSLFGEMDGIKVYIYPTIAELSEKGMGNDWGYLHGVTGFSNPTKRSIYIASFYEGSRDLSYLLRVPRHELVHLYFGSSTQWLFEGVAHYFGDLIRPFSTLSEIATGTSDLVFFGDVNARTQITYNNCGWMAKFVFEEKLNEDPVKLRAFSRSTKPFQFLGYRDEKGFFLEYRKYVQLKAMAW